jgi:feruloyl esterase
VAESNFRIAQGDAMIGRITSLGVLCLAGTLHAQESSVPSAACERLGNSLSLPNTEISAIEAVAAGGFTVPQGAAVTVDLPAFCRVELTIRPSPASDIRSEVWLPLVAWNGKFLQVGNGGWGGSIQYAALAEGLRRGYAVASTDTGHRQPDGSFALGQPEKLKDFGYRAVHETAAQGKAVVAALFGTPARYAYFDGCSGGGRQAFMEAQRFPTDFDGIIAGAPGFNRTDVAFQTIGMAQATHLDAESFIPPDRYSLIHEAAIAACDRLDGLEDRLISDPRRCDFDPGVLQCRGSDAQACLSPAQVAAARKIYAPVVDPRSNTVVAAGLEPGSELHWGGVAGAEPHAMYHGLFRFVVFEDPAWDFRSLDVAKHLDRARRADSGILGATSTDLSEFIDHGGKLLMYHGWADQNIPPRGSVVYYEALRDTLGPTAIDDAVRLYMVPGMGHCGGGHGPNEFDMLGVLEQWREHGRAPADIVAAQREGNRVLRTRPLCPYPQQADYTGTGPVDRSESFICAVP